MKMHLSKRRCRYKIVLEGQTEEHTDKQVKTSCADPGIVRGSPDPTGRKSSDNFELGILQFYSGEPMVKSLENYCFPRFKRGSIIFQWGLNFFRGAWSRCLFL